MLCYTFLGIFLLKIFWGRKLGISRHMDGAVRYAMRGGDWLIAATPGTLVTKIQVMP